MSQSDKTDLVFGALIMVLALLFIFAIIPAGITAVPGPAALSPRFWPRLIGWFLMVPGAIIVIGALLRARRGSHTSPARDDGIPIGDVIGRVALAILGMVGFALLLPVLGIFVTSVALILISAPLLGNRNWMIITAVGFLVPLALSLFFSRVAGTALPRGIFDFLPF